VRHNSRTNSSCHLQSLTRSFPLTSTIRPLHGLNSPVFFWTAIWSDSVTWLRRCHGQSYKKLCYRKEERTARLLCIALSSSPSLKLPKPSRSVFKLAVACGVQFVHVVNDQGGSSNYEMQEFSWQATRIWFEKLRSGMKISILLARRMGIATAQNPTRCQIRPHGPRCTW